MLEALTVPAGVSKLPSESIINLFEALVANLSSPASPLYTVKLVPLFSINAESVESFE